ncbi:type I glyceraldehyde-3-phosphate dehydrogenase [Candidatus Woesearchaeota archaeon]|nr:type I glyceraldehyde-3-phosphate dehydrogenase [Candidatus Woesearchaeota archaeon]
MVRIAINGFGRIGRQIFQIAQKTKGIDVIAINDLTNNKTLAHLLKYDSVYGRFIGNVDFDEKNIIINNKKIPCFSEKDPEKLPWKRLRIDAVAECTGFFTNKKGSEKHLKAGAKKVLISAPAKQPDITVVKGVNLNEYKKSEHNIISNASCTTNCIAPMVKVLNDKFGILKGFMNTVHSYTASQKLVDGPHKDLRRARAAAANIVPTTTGATKAVIETIPELKGKLSGMAMRVPAICGSICQFSAVLKKTVTKDEINNEFKRQAETKLKEIIEYADEPIVSSDIIKNPASCIFDSLATDVIENNLVSICGWYDNEWGYSARMVDVLKHLMK